MRVLLLVYLINIAFALVIYDSHLASSCIYYLRDQNWNCTAMGGHMSSSTWTCQCYNFDWLGSITNCIYDYHNSTHQLDHAYHHIMERCRVRAGTNHTLKNMYFFQESSSNYLQDSLSFSSSDVITAPLYIKSSDFHWWYQSFKHYNDFVTMCQNLGWGCVGYWIAVFGIAGLYNYSCASVPFVNRLRLKKRIFGLSDLEIIVCSGFFLLVLLSCCINYSLELNAYLTTQYFKLLDLISFRTDIIAFSLMPVLYLMGIRNNPFQVIGLVAHDTMIRFHKIVGGIFFILVIIHSVIWTHYARSPDGGGYKVWVVDPYFYWGVIGTIVIGLMVGLSIKPIRSLCYEGFLIFHKCFSILFIAAMWLHCKTLGWMGWVYSLIGILCFERVARIIRICMNGFINDATITVCGELTLKITIPKPRFFKFYPGCYVFLTFLTPVTSCWQSHPFTVVSSYTEDKTLSVYIRAKTGITKKLMQLDTAKVLCDGPYGGVHIPLAYGQAQASSTLYIAGGVGISSILSHLNHNKNYDFTKAKLYWTTHDLGMIDRLSENLVWLGKQGLEIEVFYTGHEKSEGPFGIIYEKLSLQELLPNSLTPRKIYASGPRRFTKEVSTLVAPHDDVHIENHDW